MAGVDGVEPSRVGVKVLCLTTWLHPNMVEGEGFEPPNSERSDLQSGAVSQALLPLHGAGDRT